MEHVWQWVWDRFGPRYSWAVFAVGNTVILPIWVTVAVVLAAMTDADHYAVAVALGLAFGLPALALIERPGGRVWRPVERWAAGERTDRAAALAATYAWGRISLVRSTLVYGVAGAAMGCAVAALGGERGLELAQYSIAGGSITVAIQAIALHQFAEALLRPARIAIAGDTEVGDAMPRSRPTFATWSNLATLATAWAFSFAGAAFAAVFAVTGETPILTVVIAIGLTVGFAVPITVGTSFAPALRPIRDLAEGTERVASGDYTQRLPVVQDDDLGALAASFNRMQAGLAERERLRSAFGSYVDPVLAGRLLEQGDDVFTGERRDVTVMFVDIRDFTPFAESHSAEDTVSHLNALFEIVVPTVLDAGGHVNKYLGDGAMAVFGAPNTLERHADAAVGAAVRIHQAVAARFGGILRIGIGINTGLVISGTIGGGGKLEFTLIGDTVNVAARVEQLTKTTGDAILVTEQTVEALEHAPADLVDRGEHELKGKSRRIRVHALA